MSLLQIAEHAWCATSIAALVYWWIHEMSTAPERDDDDAN